MYTYEHGGNMFYKNPNCVDFSANINPLGMNSGVKNMISNDFIKNLNKYTIYPDQFSNELREKISLYENVNKDYIICSNGASDLIFRLAFAIKPKKSLVLAPTFSDYARAIKVSGGEVFHHYLYEENNFNLQEDVLEIIEKGNFDLIYICNPNNPTGCVIDQILITKIIKICEKINCIIAFDECFIDFLENNADFSAKIFLENNKNLIIFKAFTKFFALAGIRLGYALTSNIKLIQKLYFSGADWAVSSIAQKIGIASLENCKQYIIDTKKYIFDEKKKLTDVLKDTGFKIFESKANYIFFKVSLDFDFGKEMMNTYNIYLRCCTNYKGLDKNFYRIGILESSKNNIFIKSLQKFQKTIN